MIPVDRMQMWGDRLLIRSFQKPEEKQMNVWKGLWVVKQVVEASLSTLRAAGCFLGEPFEQFELLERFELLLRSKDEAAKHVTTPLTLWHRLALSKSGQILTLHCGDILGHSR